MPNYEPPRSMEAEQAVLGAILVNPAQFADILELLTVSDFYRESHGKIYQTMLDLLEEGVPVDIVTVSERLKDRGELEGVGGPVFLAGLSEEVGYATNIVTYAQIVHDKSTLRRLIEVGQGLCQECFNGKAGDIQKIIEAHQNKISEIEGGARFKGGKNIAKRIRSYLEVTDGNVEVTKLYKDLLLVTEGNKKAALMAIGRLVKEGVLVKIRPGFYRVIENDALPINILAPDPGAEIRMCYPFGIERWFITYQKTLILISGEPDAGKTAWLLNIARDNMHLMPPIRYWSSEMGAPELISRLESFDDFDRNLWFEKVKFAERAEKFEDVIRLYPDAIHIVDNLEMHDEFWKVGGEIDAIWRALGKGVVIIGLHKEKGKQYALGGMQMAKRPKLWINLEARKGGGNSAKVCKAKNWRDKLTNIKNMTLDYHLIKGCKIVEME